ncbi:hypothetical protein K456DRAFT_43954 [Colletotrichum gloeosporioides 23]|nr:hypothetical protein K456DRAFT_43954 [Colletotrichum gloeosporioides 23]
MVRSIKTNIGYSRAVRQTESYQLQAAGISSLLSYVLMFQKQVVTPVCLLRTTVIRGLPTCACKYGRTTSLLPPLRRKHLCVSLISSSESQRWYLAYRLNDYRKAKPIPVSSTLELKSKLRSDINSESDVMETQPSASKPVVFVLTGPYYHSGDMDSSLYKTSDVFREVVDLCQTRQVLFDLMPS